MTCHDRCLNGKYREGIWRSANTVPVSFRNQRPTGRISLLIKIPDETINYVLTAKPLIPLTSQSEIVTES